MSMLERKEEPWPDSLRPPEVTGVLSALQDAPWLACEEYSLADIDIAPFVQRIVRVDLFGLVAARPRVNDWYARARMRLWTNVFYRPGILGKTAYVL